MRWRILLLLTFPLLAAREARAQAVRGVVVQGDSVPVAGAVVTLVDSLGVAGATVLSDEFGRFDLRAPRRGTWRLRTEAVGFARVTSFAFELATAEVLVRRVQLTDAIARLQSIEVRDRLRCDVRPAEGTQVAILWDEARKSLANAAAAATTAPPVAFDLDEIEYDSTFNRVRSATRVTTAGRAERGYRSDAPRTLRALGYQRQVDSVAQYYAPDARVLLSDDFAATHCFRIVPDDPTSIRRVGIGFAPVGLAAGTVDVAGIIWVDRETFQLDRVEFRYEPLLSQDHPDSTFGGEVRFARLPTGHVVVTRWSLRMPIYAAADDGRVARAGQTSAMLIRPERREIVAGLKLVRGAVRNFDAPPVPLPAVTAAPRRSAGPPTCESVGGVRGSVGAVTGAVQDARGRDVSGARVRARWHQAVVSGGRVVFREQWVEAGTDPQGRYALCGLPVGVALTVAARREQAQSPGARFVLLEGAAVRDQPLRFVAAVRGASAPTTGVVRGRLLGRDRRPVPRAEVRVFPGNARILTDSLGVFVLDSAAPGLREFFVRRVGFQPVMTAVEVTAGDTASIALQLEPAAQLLEAVTVEARLSSLSLAGFEKRREIGMGAGTFIGPEEIRARENGTVQTLLRSLARVQVEESAMTGDIRAYGRGGDNPAGFAVDRCAMRLVVDGALISDPPTLNALPPLREIAAIEVYQSIGAIPPAFSFAMPECGLIVVWTRDYSGR